MRDSVRIALVGASGYGDVYLEALLGQTRGRSIELVGAIDPAPLRGCRVQTLRDRGCEVFASLEAFLNRKTADLVIISTPIHLHAVQTCQALKSGASVLCEKPLAGTMEDVWRMADCEQASKGFVAIGYQWSYSRAVQMLKRDIACGDFGRPMRFKTLVFFPRPKAYFRRNDWAGRLRLPGGQGVLDSPVNNATSHYLHNMLYLLGGTRDASAIPATVQAELYRANDIENYDTAAMRVMTYGGTELLFYTTHAAADRIDPLSQFEFENAVVEYDGGQEAAFVARFHDGRVKHYGRPNADPQRKMWQAVEAVARRKRPVCGISAASAHTLCVMAAQRPAEEIPFFPAHLLQTVLRNGEEMVCVKGLGEGLMECYRRAALPAEIDGLDWAVPALPVPSPTLEAPLRRGGMAASFA